MSYGTFLLRPPDEIFTFLKHDFAALRQHHGAIYGVRIRTPRLIPADNAA
jgi:hypothetical protein